MNRRALDRSLKMVDLLGSTQRDRDLLPDDNTFPSSCGQVDDECVKNEVDIELTSHDRCTLF